MVYNDEPVNQFGSHNVVATALCRRVWDQTISASTERGVYKPWIGTATEPVKAILQVARASADGGAIDDAAPRSAAVFVVVRP